MTDKSDLVFIEHILESINAIGGFSENLNREELSLNRLKQSAIVREIEIIGEAVKNLPKNFKIKHPKIPWKKIAGMRDILIHEYFLVDLRAVWDTSKDDLPILKKQIKDLLKRL